MSITTTTHINRDGDAAELLAFYRGVFGGEVTTVTYGMLGAAQTEADADKVVWGEVRAESGFHVMAYDVQTGLAFEPGVNPYYLSVRATDEDELRALWAGLLDGATVEQDLGPAPWGPLYGKLADRFGIVWVLDVAGAQQG
jgi:PhnB protein